MTTASRRDTSLVSTMRRVAGERLPRKPSLSRHTVRDGTPPDGPAGGAPSPATPTRWTANGGAAGVCGDRSRGLGLRDDRRHPLG